MQSSACLTMLVICLCLATVLAQSDPQEEDVQLNWSNWSNGDQYNQEVEHDISGAKREIYQEEAMPDDASSLNGRAKSKRRRNRFRTRPRQSSYPDYSIDQLEERSYYVDREGKRGSPAFTSPESSAQESVYGTSNYEATSSYNVPQYKSPSYSGQRSLSTPLAEDYDYEQEQSPSLLHKALRFFGYSWPSNTQGRGDTYYEEDYASTNTYNEDPGLSLIAGALKTLLPLGLLISALIPSHVYLPGRRKRSEETKEPAFSSYSFPFLQKIGVLGYTGLVSEECQSRIFCEMAVYGSSEDANRLQRALSYVSELTPDVLAEYIHAKQVFQAVRENHCDSFKCSVF